MYGMRLFPYLLGLRLDKLSVNIIGKGRQLLSSPLRTERPPQCDQPLYVQSVRSNAILALLRSNCSSKGKHSCQRQKARNV